MILLSRFAAELGLRSVDDLNDTVLEAQRGNSEAFDMLVYHYQNRAVAYAYTLLGSRAKAEDVAQKAFLAAWRELKTLNDTTKFAPWLRRLIFKFADRERRREHPTLPLDTLAESAGDCDAYTEVVMQEKRRDVHALVATLAETERTAITLYYLGGHSAGEIADFLQVTESTVKKRLERARKRLQERMLALMSEELNAMAPSKETRFVEIARLLREVTTVLETDKNVVAAYLAPFGKDEGFGAGNDAWASLNVHAVMKAEAIDDMAVQRGAYVRRIAEPILWVEGQQNAPPQGYYLTTVYDAPAGPYEVDWYWHNAESTFIPYDARILFNRGTIPVGKQKASWPYTNERDFPQAIKDLWAVWTPKEKQAEEARNTVHLFWLMWLISAKYCARDPKQEMLPFAEMLGNLLADARRNTTGQEWVKPEEPAPVPTIPEKAARLQELANAMGSLGHPAPEAAVRFLALIKHQ